MTGDPAARLEHTERAYQRFMAAYSASRFGEAIDIFMAALGADPDGAFRYFAASGSGQLAQALVESNRIAEAAGQLDALIADHPTINIICESKPDEITRQLRIRQQNFEKCLPSVVLISMGKSASIAVANIFNSGFRMPSVAYSLLNLQVLDNWARDFARGGACYTTHLDPSRDTVARLKAAGLDRIIVHVRDPRQALLSLVHHFDMYPDQLVNHREMGKDATTLSARAMAVLPLYASSINWIRGWLDLADEIEILFSTFEEFVTDRAAFVEKYLAFYGADRAHFSWANAFGEHTGMDNHFRRGRTDEWREVFTREDAAYLSSLLPARAKERFGWSDPAETAARPAGRPAPADRDRIIAWLKGTSVPGDAAARAEVRRLLAAGASPPPDLEESAVRAELRDYPDRGDLLLRLWHLITQRAGEVPGELPIYALRCRLAELSGPPAPGGDAAARERERAEVARELAMREILEAQTKGASIRSLLSAGHKMPDTSGYVMLGQRLIGARDLDGAEAALRQAVALDAAAVDAPRHLADVLDAQGRSRDAIPILQRLLAIRSDDVGLHARLAQLMLRCADFAGAEAVLRRAIELDPASVDFRRLLADVLDAQGRSSEGAEILQGLAAKRSSDAPLQARLGQLLIRGGQLHAAEAAYRRAIALDPAPLAFRLALADVLAATGRGNAAVEMLQWLAAQESCDPQLYLHLGRLLQRRGDLGGAAEAIGRALAIEPENAALHDTLAAIAEQQQAGTAPAVPVAAADR